MTPSSGATTQQLQITIAGEGILAGSVLELESGGGSFSNVSRSSDGLSMTATWAVGTRPGSYTLAVVNPDRGRGQFDLTVVQQSTPAVTSVAPSSAVAGQTQPLVLTGSDFQPGVVLQLPGAGSVTTPVVTSDGRQISTNWTPGTTPGTYPVTVLNPDGGRAQTTLTVLPAAPARNAANDCSTTYFTYYGYKIFYSAVRNNDSPKDQGTISVINPPQNVYYLDSSFNTVANGSPAMVYIAYATTSGSGQVSVNYKTILNGVDSNPATVVFKFSGSC